MIISNRQIDKMIKENTSECSNINMHNGFLEISKRCKINCISGHIVPRIYNSLAKKVWSDTRSKLFWQQVIYCSLWLVFGQNTHTNCSSLVPMTKLIRPIRQVNCHGAPVGHWQFRTALNLEIASQRGCIAVLYIYRHLWSKIYRAILEHW